ncbi:MAG: hypothetical protein IT330_16660 [Anaerolineae bacterium]|nr:hypothetical protein [Anaerolineae bacterium]
MRFLVLRAGWYGGQEAVIGEGSEMLRAAGSVETVHQQAGEKELPARFLERLPEATAVVVSPWFWPATTPGDWRRAARLKVLAGTFDNRFGGWLNFQEMAARGIAVVDTSRSMTPSVAEFALAMTLNLIRDIPAGIEEVRRGGWKPAPCDLPGFVYGDLTGRRVGLAGFGSINRRYSELLAPFRCEIGVYDPFVGDETLQRVGARRLPSLIELARFSEVFVVGIPPTPMTHKIINEAVINALPEGALFVLVTRMAVVEQDALWRRIQAGGLRAAVDVFAPEPPPAEAWFRRHPHVLPTPHMAGDTIYCHRRCFTDACHDAIAVLRSEPPRFGATLWDHQVYQGQL